MNNDAIDRAILSVVSTAEGGWRKVAMVISRVADGMSGNLPEGDDGYNLVAQRIEALVSDGRLLAQGNIKNWRFSEVRRPK
jgi:hypothetical protein